MRRFNVTGLCVPEEDYMVDLSGRVAQIKELIDKRSYFTINRARQYGKTTLLAALERALAGDYAVAFISFEGLGCEEFLSSETFCRAFVKHVGKALKPVSCELASKWLSGNAVSFDTLSDHITDVCCGEKIVLMVDEVDKASNNQVFLNFLSVLRSKFLARKQGKDNTFHSVILAGVHDIKNIKLKLVKEGLTELSTGERQFNSPWNIAADFHVDMSFSTGDISAMLNQYEQDWQTGMDIAEVSQEIYDYTGGYPFLVSNVCKLIDEKLGKDWSILGVREAVNRIIGERSALFDDLVKNLESYKNLYDFLYLIVMHGEKPRFMLYKNEIYLAATFGYIKDEDKKVIISSRIFGVLLLNYFVSVDEETASLASPAKLGLYYEITESGAFDMELCLRKFAEYYRGIYAKRHIAFLEEHGELILLSFLKPLVNGNGFFYIESRLMDKRRIDIIAVYKTEQFIIELKLWRGEAYREKAVSQLLGYMDAKKLDKGYLVTFDLRKDENKEFKAEWVDARGKKIFEVIM